MNERQYGRPQFAAEHFPPDPVAAAYLRPKPALAAGKDVLDWGGRNCNESP